MKTNTLFCLSLASITLVAGDLGPLVSEVAAPKVATTPNPLPTETGPLRHLSAATAGRVWEVYVQTGSPVKRGQLLAKLGVALHTVAQQALEAELTKAEWRHKLLFDSVPGTVSADSLAQANQRVIVVRQQLATTPKQVSFIFIQAPAAGIVAAPPAQTGTYISAADTVVSLRLMPTRRLGTLAN